MSPSNTRTNHKPQRECVNISVKRDRDDKRRNTYIYVIFRNRIVLSPYILFKMKEDKEISKYPNDVA